MKRPDPWLAACLAVSAALTLLVGRQVIFGRGTLVNTDFLTSRPPWGPPEATDAFVRNHLQEDIVEFTATHSVAASEALREGRLLLWNPAIFCGLPSAGDPQLGTFYLPRLLCHLLFPPLPALDLFVLFHYFLLGPAMYALLREFRAGRPAALLSSATWMLCGQQMIWFKYGSGLVAGLFLPLMALTMERALARRSLPWIGAAGAVWAVLFLGAHPQLSFLALVWAGIALIARSRSHGPRWTLAAAAVFGVAGAGLAAVQLFPFLESLAQSHKLAGEPDDSFRRPWRVPMLLVTLLWQRAFGSPIDRLDVTMSWTGTSFFEYQGYMGLLPLFLAFFAQRSKLLWLTALVTLALATLYPAWWLVTRILPPLHVMVPHRLFLFAFAMSILAGLGLERALADPPGRRTACLGAAVAAAVLLIGLIGRVRGATWLSVGNPSFQDLTLAALGAAATGAFLCRPGPAAPKAALALAAVLADLLPGFLAYNASHGPLPPAPGAFAALPREDRVVSTLASAYWKRDLTNYLMLYGLSTPTGFASQYPQAYAELVAALGGDVLERSVYLKEEDRRALRMLNVRALLTPEGIKAVDALPRAWIVSDWETLADRESRLARLADSSFDPGRTVILERDPGPRPAPGARGRVERTGRDAYRVACDRPCLLVISETWDAGWTCEVDGRRVPIERANHALRAVPLEAGTHRLTFAYRPRSLAWGAAVTLLTILTGSVLLWLSRRSPGQARSPTAIPSVSST